MKKLRNILRALSFTALLPLLAAGCSNFFAGNILPPEAVPAAGSGLLIVSLTGVNVNPSLDGRTMLPQDPEFTRYELVFTKSDGSATVSGDPGYGMEPYTLYNSSIQLQLPAGTYYMVAWAYTGEKPTARSLHKEVVVPSSGAVSVEFTLKPYMDDSSGGVTGTLSYSLSWDGLTRMPYRAELLIEEYKASAWTPIPVAYIPPELSPGSQPGTIQLLDSAAAAIKLTGSLQLPAGQYRLTLKFTMDQGGQSVSQMDVAHIYSNLTTPAVFHYGSGNILISSTGVDMGPGLITRFTFTDTGLSNATTVIGSAPGTDGTRLIMVMVPSNTDLKDLTPKVEISAGAKILSPLPEPYPYTSDTPYNPGDPMTYTKGQIDFTDPAVWTVAGKDGAVQKYTVVVSKEASGSAEKRITYFSFVGYPNYPGIIKEGTSSGTITVKLPAKKLPPDQTDDTDLTSLSPVISIIGESVTQGASTPVGTHNFSSPLVFQVHAVDSSVREYTVTVEKALGTDKEITAFALDGYPGVTAAINQATGAITAALPYGSSLSNLTPLIQYKGKSINPDSGTAQNFNVPVVYTVTADDDSTKKYTVTLSTQPANRDTGIFDFVIKNQPNCKVVIGQSPRPDGKIPIVIQVPFGTDEYNLIPGITLRSSTSYIPASSAVKDGIKIPFTGQQAVLRVNSQDNAVYQEYVVVVSMGGQYYYVNGVSGRDDYPDYYTGESEDRAFKTLAYAVYKASRHATINKIFVSGTLNNSTEGGAWETASDPNINTGFHSSGSTSGSVFTLIGTNFDDPPTNKIAKKITVTGVNNAVLEGTAGKRVISITGGAELIFEDITIRGGNTGANGGGIYIGGDSKVKFTGGSITGNRALSGGGVYIEGNSTGYSGFTLMGGTISGNTASGGSGAFPALTGGGGVCIVGKALFWMASGSISGNFAGASSGTSYGSGGGVLIRAASSTDSKADEDGFLMSSGSVSNNRSYSNVYPHGGGGVYVATGVFEMLGGEITGNNSVRQGGGVFIHRGGRFSASGNSTITGNEGVGSSKDICSRGITELIGNAQVGKVYVWNVLPDSGEYGYTSNPNSTYIADNYFHFEIQQGARISGIVLAHPPSFDGEDHYNVINVSPDGGIDQICRIDLEMNLVNGVLATTDINAWIGKRIVWNGNTPIPYARFPMNSLVGKSTMYLTDYRVTTTAGSLDDTNGNLRRK